MHLHTALRRRAPKLYSFYRRHRRGLGLRFDLMLFLLLPYIMAKLLNTTYLTVFPWLALLVLLLLSALLWVHLPPDARRHFGWKP